MAVKSCWSADLQQVLRIMNANWIVSYYVDLTRTSQFPIPLLHMLEKFDLGLRANSALAPTFQDSNSITLSTDMASCMTGDMLMRQVLGEDLVLVAGQQDRMQRGADVWSRPVAYDKLAVRYRRWRNSLSSNDETEKAEAAAALNVPLSAGQMFALEESG